MSTAPAIDQDRLMSFLFKVVNDFGSSLSMTTALIGDRLGLYRAMRDGGAMDSKELAAKTGTSERYIREWLINQAAGGYVEYDPKTAKFTLPPEQAFALADEDSPVNLCGGFQLMSAMAKADERITHAFKTGEGMGWGEHHHDLFTGTERFFRASYLGHLVNDWIPALEGVKDKLERGAKVADVGCGHGASTIIMAKAFPRSRFHGFDLHAPSIARANEAAREAGLSDRVTFEASDAATWSGGDYDLVCFFDCLHDLGEPTAACRRAYAALRPGGTLMVVEPMAGRTLEENLNPVGRLFAGASVMCCTPNALATGGHALGTIATDDALQGVAMGGGFASLTRATETPFNRVFTTKR